MAFRHMRFREQFSEAWLLPGRSVQSPLETRPLFGMENKPRLIRESLFRFLASGVHDEFGDGDALPLGGGLDEGFFASGRSELKPSISRLILYRDCHRGSIQLYCQRTAVGMTVRMAFTSDNRYYVNFLTGPKRGPDLGWEELRRA